MSTDAIAQLEEGNNRELDMLFDKVTQIKRLSQQINNDLDVDSAVVGRVQTKLGQTQSSLFSTLDNLSESLAANKYSFCKLIFLAIIAMMVLYYLLSMKW